METGNLFRALLGDSSAEQTDVLLESSSHRVLASWFAEDLPQSSIWRRRAATLVSGGAMGG